MYLIGKKQSRAKDRPAELGWNVIPAADHLERLLPPASLDTRWYRSFWSNLREFATPAGAPLDITSKPVVVRDIWGQYGPRKKSWIMSVAVQSAAVLLLFTVASTKGLPDRLAAPFVSLVAPNIAPYEVRPAHTRTASGGGGGGDRSPLPASKGRLPKKALREFVAPMAVVNNLNPKLSMEMAILALPDVQLRQVDMTEIGDPLGKIGPRSNGPGSNGGIGSGSNGGDGPGDGGGAGPGKNGGESVDGGVFRVGDGVTPPHLLLKVEPEYSEEARKAKYQGTVVLRVEVDASGRATNIRVQHSLGLGLDEKAMEAVRKWKFSPGKKDGKPVTVAALVEVNFRLL